MSAFNDKWEYFYVKYLKKWMFCPACDKNNRMKYNRKTDMWECQKCNYKIPGAEFNSDYIFWFCDCNAFLNNQSGFDIKKSTWKCTVCGYENNLTVSNIINVCKDCNVRIPIDSKGDLCDNCRSIRKQKRIERLQVAGIIAGTALAAVAAYYGSKSSGASNGTYNEGSSSYNPNLDPDVRDLTNSGGEAMKCANCGNEDSRKLWDESDTIYCSVCCHRTVKATGQDDLIECPYCKRLRDRKAYQCCWCGHSLNEYFPPTPEETEELNEILSDFDRNLDSSNKRFWNIRKKQ